MGKPLLSNRTLQELREYFVSTSLAAISDAFSAVGLYPTEGYQPPVSGQRRSLVERIYYGVDFRDPTQAGRVLEVFEHVLVDLSLRNDQDAPWAEDWRNRLLAWLRRDGVDLREDGALVTRWSSVGIGVGAHAKRIDAPELVRQIERLRSAVDTDPRLAIGTAKELIETTCKTILNDRGIEFAADLEVPGLVKQARKALMLMPEQIPADRRGADAIKKILGSLGSIGHSLAELRNSYGTGHGADGRAVGLGPRHARLAAESAAALAGFLLETHEALPSSKEVD